MGTQGSGRKRAPLKDRFSAEDEALSSIAREVCTSHQYISFVLFLFILPMQMNSYSLECVFVHSLAYFQYLSNL